MPYMLERYGDKAIVVNTMTGRHHSMEPISLQNAKAQKRVLEAAAVKEKPMKDDPCWEGYEMFGMKEKGGRKVPNCVPKKRKE